MFSFLKSFRNCGIIILLFALLQIFFVLDASTSMWVRTIAVVLVLAAAYSPLQIIEEEEDTKMSVLKFLSYLCLISGGILLFILCFPPKADSLISFSFSSMLFTFGISLLVFEIWSIIALMILGYNNRLSIVLSILSGLSFIILFCIPVLPQNLFSIPYALCGVAYLTMKSF